METPQCFINLVSLQWIILFQLDDNSNAQLQLISVSFEADV